MSNQEEHQSGNGDKRQVILDRIKGKMRNISGGDMSEPVYLRNVSVLDTECSANGDPVYLIVNSIFCDDNNVLCGDLIPDFGALSNGIIFGQSIEDIQIEDLDNILEALDGDSWSIILNKDSTRGKQGFPLVTLFKRDRDYACGA